MKKNAIIIVIGAVILSFIAYENARYTLDDDDLVVITQFGELTGTARNVSGEYFKIPFIHKAHYLIKTPRIMKIKPEIMTKDRQVHQLESRAVWKISDPVKYYRSLNSDKLARDYVYDKVVEALYPIIDKYEYKELIDEAKSAQLKELYGRYDIQQRIKEASESKLSDVGIGLDYFELKLAGSA
ncbi:MAG: SPFH domain-containing protein [Deltaproteobacteria bacterium]|nr:SPFH domain-containing protein [Deltaproteobacteria bacterium]